MDRSLLSYRNRPKNAVSLMSPILYQLAGRNACFSLFPHIESYIYVKKSRLGFLRLYSFWSKKEKNILNYHSVICRMYNLQSKVVQILIKFRMCACFDCYCVGDHSKFVSIRNKKHKSSIFFKIVTYYFYQILLKYLLMD